MCSLKFFLVKMNLERDKIKQINQLTKKAKQLLLLFPLSEILYSASFVDTSFKLKIPKTKTSSPNRIIGAYMRYTSPNRKRYMIFYFILLGHWASLLCPLIYKTNIRICANWRKMLVEIDSKHCVLSTHKQAYILTCIYIWLCDVSMNGRNVSMRCKRLFYKREA